MRLLITGASGLYGSRMAELSATNGFQVYSVYNQHQAPIGVPILLDIMNKAKTQEEIKKINPDVIVHAGALTNVDKCELDKDLAWKINFEGTRNVVEATKECGSFLLYVSTDYVFDGSKGCYSETDLPSPISYYAYSKLKAEEHVQGALNKYCIVRPSVIYGANPAAGKDNFALWLLEKLRRKEKTKVFADQWNSPTLNTSLAEMTLEVIKRKLVGIYHLSGATRISRFDFAVTFAQVFGLDTSLLVSTAMKEFDFPAKRPRDSSLNTTKAERILKNKPLSIENALDRLKAELNS